MISHLQRHFSHTFHGMVRWAMNSRHIRGVQWRSYSSANAYRLKHSELLYPGCGGAGTCYLKI